MTKKPIDLIQQALNKPIWQAKQVYGSFLTFDMGEKLAYKEKDGSLYEPGSVRLSIYLCYWAILKNGNLLAYCESDRTKIEKSLELIYNQKIICINNPDVETIKIEFSNGITLILKGGSYDKIDDLFRIFMPNTILAYSREFGFVVEEDL